MRFLVNERGLSATTVKGYLSIVRAFLADRFETRTADLESLTAGDCHGFILRYGGNVCWRTFKMSAAAPRSFLRHLHQEGEIPADLADGILPAMKRRQPELPRSRRSSAAATGRPPPGDGTTPSCYRFRGWACAPAKPSR
ncbi:MAG: hypothetical protein OXI87_23950 [Albidovulum sp.]|nr:hypothetical protein [Albidovulum sp.]MDE0530816.1 hypothetical protein [Albidovulum sp.]